MIDSIGGSASLPSSQSLLQANRLRDTGVLTAIQQTSPRASSAVEPVRVFSVSQTSEGNSTSSSRLPRGSLVDIWA